MKPHLLLPALLFTIVAAIPVCIASPSLNSQVLLRGFHYPDGSNPAVWQEWATNGILVNVNQHEITVHEEVIDPPPFSTEVQIYSGHRFESDAFASAGFQASPVLRCFAQMDLNNAPFTPVSASFTPNGTRDHRVNAISTFSDDIMISVPALPINTPVRYTLSFGISGFKSTLLRGQSGGTIAFLPPYTPARLGATVTGQSGHGYNFLPVESNGAFNFSATVPNNSIDHFILTLFVSVTSDYYEALNQHSNTFAYYGTQGRCDFSSTVVLKAITVADLNGNPLANAQVSGSDGVVWSPVIEPKLNVSFVNSQQARITWPTNGPDFALQFVTSLPATEWTTITNTPTVIDDQFALSVETTAGPKFYRLRKP